MNGKKNKSKKMAAHNGRFGASGAVARPKVCANLKVFAPVRTLVKAPPAPSRWDVVRKCLRCVGLRLTASSQVEIFCDFES